MGYEKHKALVHTWQVQMSTHTSQVATQCDSGLWPIANGGGHWVRLSDMLQARLTFEEALAAASLTIMTRQRLKIIKEKLFDHLDQAAVL